MYRNDRHVTPALASEDHGRPARHAVPRCGEHRVQSSGGCAYGGSRHDERRTDPVSPAGRACSASTDRRAVRQPSAEILPDRPDRLRRAGRRTVARAGAPGQRLDPDAPRCRRTGRGPARRRPSGPRLENRPSRARSDSGRVPSGTGASRIPFASPAITARGCHASGVEQPVDRVAGERLPQQLQQQPGAASRSGSASINANARVRPARPARRPPPAAPASGRASPTA